jgi:hypothetical protein
MLGSGNEGEIVNGLGRLNWITALVSQLLCASCIA